MTTTRRAAALLLAGAAALAGATALALAGIEPFPTWHYVFAWAAVLLMADAAVALLEGRFYLLGRPAFLATLLAWSFPFWFLFELFNFRLENWYYVYVPADRASRWAGTALAYATVLPAILVAERLLRAAGVARRTGIARLKVTPGLLRALQATGVAMLALSMAWPRAFFPLVWGGVALLADPFVHRRAPERSLLGDLERGNAGRPLRVLLGGLTIGLVWESLNAAALTRWIYTVPGFEDVKVFEMPVLGFLGFPVFAVEGFTAWQALVVSGLAVPREGAARPAPWPARLAAGAGALVFSTFVLSGMERDTFASTKPRLDDLPGLPPAAAAALRAEGLDAFELARAEPGQVAAVSGAPAAEAAAWVDVARLAALRGIGARGARALGAVEVRSVEALAGQDPDRLAAGLAAAGRPVPPPRVRIWVGAAREEEGHRETH